MTTFWGKVRFGNKRGKDLGFPTANISLHKALPEGIYLSVVSVQKKKHNALTFIGKAETFNESDYKAETYILNFNLDIYHLWITITLLKKIRENKKFNSVDALIVQMRKDKKEAEEYFNTHHV